MQVVFPFRKELRGGSLLKHSGLPSWSVKDRIEYTLPLGTATPLGLSPAGSATRATAHFQPRTVAAGRLPGFPDPPAGPEQRRCSFLCAGTGECRSTLPGTGPQGRYSTQGMRRKRSAETPNRQPIPEPYGPTICSTYPHPAAARQADWPPFS